MRLGSRLGLGLKGLVHIPAFCTRPVVKVSGQNPLGQNPPGQNPLGVGQNPTCLSFQKNERKTKFCEAGCVWN